MVFSHLATMWREPGFVPFNYEYDTDKIPKELIKFLFKEQLKDYDPDLEFMCGKDTDRIALKPTPAAGIFSAREEK